MRRFPKKRALKPREKRSRTVAGLTVAEWLAALLGLGTLLTAVGGLWVSWLTYQNAKDTSDLKAAVGNLAALAEQTKRQADATNGQVALVAEQVRQARKQTEAISEQTTAIKESAEANVSSALAQKRTAELSASATKPEIRLVGVDISGLTLDEVKDGKVSVGLKPQFRNVGGSAINVQESWFVLSIGKKPPTGFNSQGAARFGGTNELVALPSSEFGPSVALPYQLARSDVDDLITGRTTMWLFGDVRFIDTTGALQSFCFVYSVQTATNPGKYVRYIPTPAHRCGKA